MNARPLAVQLVVLAGLVALALVGPVAAIVAGLVASACIGAALLRPYAARVPWGLLTVAVVGAMGVAAAYGVAAPEALGVLLAYLQLHRRVTRAAIDDDRASVVLAALMLVASGGVTADPLFSVLAVVWALALPVALAPADVPLRTAAGASALVVPVAVALFVVAPRWVRPEEADVDATGFSEQVELGVMDRLVDDPSEVFRAAPVPQLTGTPYWRGLALDRFDGRRWTSGGDRVAEAFQASPPPTALAVTVIPSEAGTAFTLGRVLELSSDRPVLSDGQGGYTLPGEPAEYRFFALPPFGPGAGPTTAPEADRAALERALQLPADLDPRVQAVAAQVAGDDPSPLAQVERIAAWLRSGYAYTRSPGDAGADAPLADFLFESRAGHCEYFASALAVLARARGIPARVVNGYVGGEVGADGWWVVRRYHAHAWVEVHADGWIPVDATPGPAAASLDAPSIDLGALVRRAWADAVLDYDRTDQVDAVLLAGRAVEELIRAREAPSVPWTGLAVLGGAWLVLAVVARLVAPRIARRLLDAPRPEPAGPVASAHHRARREVERAGHHIPRALPPVEAARWLQAHAPGDPADALHDLAWLYYAVHLGGADASAAAPRARELLDRVKRLSA